MKRFLCSLLAVGMVLSFSACGGKASAENSSSGNTESAASAVASAVVSEAASAAGSAGGGQVTIGFSPYTLTNEYFSAVLKGVQAGCDKLGYKLLYYDPQNNATTQASQIEDMLSRGIKALVYIPQDSSGARTICQECKKAGVKVINIDNVVQKSDYDVVDAVIASDNEGLGKLSGQWVAKHYPNGANVLIVHLQTAQSCVINVQGFWDGIKETKGSLDGYKNIQTVEGGGATDVSFKAVSDALQAHKDINVIYCINDTSAAGAIKAVQEAGMTGKISVLGKDAAPIGKHAISEGTEAQSSGQKPTYMGYTAVQYASKLLGGEKVPFNTAVPAYNVDSSNIKSFNLDSWDTLEN